MRRYRYRPVLRNREVYPADPHFFSIPDLGSNNSKKEVGRKFFCHTFFVASNFKKIEKNYLILKRYRKKFQPIDKEFNYFLTQKLLHSTQKNGFGIRDPRSEKTYPES
jgi:hypothetical protein